MTKQIIFSLLLLFATTGFAQQLAFPGAEGFGKYALGGRNGSVYRVTNLNDSGSGSLRDAISQPNRIIVFEVGGVIKINSALVFRSNQYIAGQTAPGEGITVYGNRVSFSGAQNTICRYMTFRMGEKYGDSGKDACGVSNGSDLIFDHCSFSWGRDEVFSINWDKKGIEPTNITIQNCIMSQGLMSHSAGGLMQTNGGITLYRNLYVDNSTRNNKVKGKNQYVNNIVYNWKNAAYIMGGDSEGRSYAHIIGNYFIKGPDNGSTPLSGANNLFSVYAEDNWHDNNKNGILDGYLIPRSEYSGGPNFVDKPYDYPEIPTLSAVDLFDDLLPTVGASLPYSDYADFYVIDEVKSLGTKGALITSEVELPFGAPDTWSLWSGNTRLDTDKDGIPDEWEIANGLNPNNAADAMAKAANDYTNIENYINSITAEYSQPFLRKPLNLQLQASTQNSITLAWLNYTDNEKGFIIERKVDGGFVEIGRAAANENTFLVENLLPEESGVYRIKAYNEQIESEYSIELTAKSKPIPVEVLDINTFVPDVTWTGAVNQNWDKATLNWINGESRAFADNNKVLFPHTDSNFSIQLIEDVAPDAIVVSSASDYAFEGSVAISGTASVNKAGSGKLSLLTNNTYTGATVMHGGELIINKLANGGQASSIGASANYDFNWVWRGGKITYTGGSVTTDRNVALENDTEFNIENSAAIVNMQGNIKGQGGLHLGGKGTLYVTSANNYEGATFIHGGTLELNGIPAIEGGLGSSNKVVLAGGRLKTSGGNASNYENYTFDIEVEKDTISTLEFFRNCYIKNKVSGQGDLNFNISYVREYIQGDWSQFSGKLFANGLGTTSDGNQLLINNVNGMPNARLMLTGTTKVVCWKNASTMRLGGLSGNSGTMLAGADKQNNASTMTWIVGGAGTEETFSGLITNECSSRGYNGTTSIVKEGTGIWRLNGNNSYKGTTKVTDGTLVINGYQSGAGLVTVEAGVLAGRGRVAGNVQVNEDAIFAPGDSSIAAFAIGGSLVLLSGSAMHMEISKGQSVNDRVNVSSAVTYSGKLVLTITGVLAAGDEFILFTGASHSGQFEAIEPATPGENMHWVFENGVLKVMPGTSVPSLEQGYFQLFPNPATDKVKVMLDTNYERVEASIKTLGGSVMAISATRGNSFDFDLSQFSSGVYFVEIIADGKKLPVGKLVKK